jgi:hypothetical protein
MRRGPGPELKQIFLKSSSLNWSQNRDGGKNDVDPEKGEIIKTAFPTIPENRGFLYRYTLHLHE